MLRPFMAFMVAIFVLSSDGSGQAGNVWVREEGGAVGRLTKYQLAIPTTLTLEVKVDSIGSTLAGSSVGVKESWEICQVRP